MIKAILIDDEEHCLDTLSIILKDFCPQVEIREQCLSAKAGIKAIKELSPDLVFLDIEMPSMNGFEMLEQFPEINFAIIFTTSYDQYAIKAIRFSALDYLLKPIDPKDLIAAIHKVETQKKLPGEEQFKMLLDKMHDKEVIYTKIPVPTSDGFELVPVDEIIRCEASDNYTFFYLKGKKKITACRMLKEVEEQLNEFGYFVRTHHSYLINIKEATKYLKGEGGSVIMSDGSHINVSRSRKDNLLIRLGNKRI
ncbi:LytTR family DNA-binding domain-containing protein [soil metagenome]